MTETAPIKQNIFEKIRTKANNGWEKLKSNWPIFKEETRLEGGLVKDIYLEVKDEIGNKIKDNNEKWKDSGKNFGERLINTTKNAWEGLKEGVTKIGHWVSERANNLKNRYQKEGIVGATLGIVEEAIDVVRQLPTKAMEKINENMAIVQDLKMIDLKDEKRGITKKSKKNRPEGWQERLQIIDSTYNHVKERRELFSHRYELCQERLRNMKEGRNKLMAAKSINLTAMPATG